MVTKIMEWESITALLMVVSWRPFTSYQIPLDFVVCASSVLGVLALFFIKHEIETHCDVDKTQSIREPGLIEEGALLLESVRSEREPWNSFYMASEIIRELRKVHESQQVSVPATKDDKRKAA